MENEKAVRLSKYWPPKFGTIGGVAEFRLLLSAGTLGSQAIGVPAFVSHYARRDTFFGREASPPLLSTIKTRVPFSTFAPN